MKSNQIINIDSSLRYSVCANLWKDYTNKQILTKSAVRNVWRLVMLNLVSKDRVPWVIKSNWGSKACISPVPYTARAYDKSEY